MVYLTRRVTFSASHRLWSKSLSALKDRDIALNLP